MRRILDNILQSFLTIVMSGLLLIFFIACFCIGVVGGFTIGCWQDIAVLDLNRLEYKEDKQTWRQHLEVYSTICEVQRTNSAVFLIDKLQRLEYEEVSPPTKGVNSQGQFHVKLQGEIGKRNGTIDVFTRTFQYPYMAENTGALRVKLTIKNGKVLYIHDEKGNDLRNFYLEPELIAEFSGDDEGTTRKIIPLTDMPRKLVDAFIAIEDRRFYQHSGIDIVRLVGAIKDTVTKSDRLGATSTLTQQLTRNVYLGKERTIARKAREILLSFRIERQLSKSQILEAYLNYIDFGRFNGQQLYGVQKAAKAYFGKEVSDLDFHECALLAGIPKGTTQYSPVKNPKNAKKRRDVVLMSMNSQGFILPKEYQESRKQPIAVVSQNQISVRQKRNTAGHFIDHLRNELEDISELKNSLYNEGLKVYTTVDMSMQSLAMQTVAEHLRYLDGKYGRHLPDYDKNKDNPKGIDPQSRYLQAALIAFEPKTGSVKAMVGGREYRIDGVNPYIREMRNYNFLNRALGNAKRQPGSAFKPIVFTALMEDPALLTPASIIVDKPWVIQHMPGQRWRPTNYLEEKFYGPVTVRSILKKSINVATAKAAWETPVTAEGYREGIVRIIDLSKRMGISTKMDPKKPALILGAFGMTVLELTSAYGVFANRGIKVEPKYIEYITDKEGEIIYPNENYQQDRTRVIDEKTAYQMTSFLHSVIKSGTGISATRDPYYLNLQNTRPVAGKTGTTNDFVDAWFIGYTNDLVVGVWVGLDKQQRGIRNYNQQGAWAALPIWARFVAEGVRGPHKDFEVPKGIEFWEIDKTTGLLRNKEKSPVENISNEPFIQGQAPTRISDKH